MIKITRKHHRQESQEVSPFTAGDHKATINRLFCHAIPKFETTKLCVWHVEAMLKLSISTNADLIGRRSALVQNLVPALKQIILDNPNALLNTLPYMAYL